MPYDLFIYNFFLLFLRYSWTKTLHFGLKHTLPRETRYFAFYFANILTHAPEYCVRMCNHGVLINFAAHSIVCFNIACAPCAPWHEHGVYNYRRQLTPRPSSIMFDNTKNHFRPSGDFKIVTQSTKAARIQNLLYCTSGKLELLCSLIDIVIKSETNFQHHL